MTTAVAALASLAAIWIGYPVVIAGLSRLRRRPVARWTGDLPSVSVVLATREGAEAIRARVANLSEAEYPADRLEILVCTDAGVTPPPHSAVAGAGANVRVVPGPPPGGKAVTVSAGAAAARGSVLVFADTAQRFARDAIRVLVDALADERVGAVSGRLVIGEDDSPRSLAEWYWRFERRLRRDEARQHSAVGVTGAIYAMRRDLFTPMPAGLILDDLWEPMHVVLRGYRVAYADGAVAQDVRRFGAVDERRRKVRTLTGVLQFCRWLPGALVPWRNPVWAQFVAHKLLRFLSPVLVTIALVGAAAASWRAALNGAMGIPPAAFAVMAAAAVVLAAVIRPLRRAAAEFVHLHVALMQAAVNGVRGNWDVW
jgi:cellulose synthase/poly-beta-1,6-N-acetylglucosamine synthase-like glycosyltransferase